VVVLAAGVGIDSQALGAAVPMLSSPGILAHSAPHPTLAAPTAVGTPDSDSAAAAAAAAPDLAMRSAPGFGKGSLFVDTLSGVHCLQRRDGRFVVGGDLRGYGVVEKKAARAKWETPPPPRAVPGATEEAEETEEAREAREAREAGALLLARAAAWLPAVGAALELEAVTRAGRVVPLDGFPAVGWSARAGAYVCAAHSGVTLAPALAALAAAEVAHADCGLEMDLLKPWRPTRFSSS